MDDSTPGYAGVDWAVDAHAVCVVDSQGCVVVEFDVAHTADGLAELCRRYLGHATPREAAPIAARKPGNLPA